jgi:hypothetical protein
MNRGAPEVSHFWQAYRAVVLRQGLPHARRDCCVRWARRFVRSGPGVPLRAGTAAHVRALVSDLGPQASLEPWQVNQAQGALRVLLQEYLPLPWARPRPLQAHTLEVARSWSQARGCRVEVSSRELDASHQAVLRRWRTARRARHSALRTERTYARGIRHVVTVHRPKSPRELGPEAAKESQG